jgi:hypothetical protein
MAAVSPDEIIARMQEPDFREAICHYGAWLVEVLGQRGRYGRYESLIHDGKIEWKDRTYRER